jgi:excisionase family DNA binding protein
VIGEVPAAYPPELLTKEQVAYLLSISMREVGYLLAEGKLTRVADGGKRIKIRLTDVRAYIESLPEKAAA